MINGVNNESPSKKKKKMLQIKHDKFNKLGEKCWKSLYC